MAAGEMIEFVFGAHSEWAMRLAQIMKVTERARARRTRDRYRESEGGWELLRECFAA